VHVSPRAKRIKREAANHPSPHRKQNGKHDTSDYLQDEYSLRGFVLISVLGSSSNEMTC
jgi:hypothetical protein